MYVDLRWVSVDHESQSLIFERQGQKPMLQCPWCGEWRSRDSFTALQTPPNYPPPRTTQIYKCGGDEGCKKLFSLGPGA